MKQCESVWSWILLQVAQSTDTLRNIQYILSFTVTAIKLNLSADLFLAFVNIINLYSTVNT